VGCLRTSSVSRHTDTVTSRRAACARSASGGPQRVFRQRPPSARGSWRGRGRPPAHRPRARTGPRSGRSPRTVRAPPRRHRLPRRSWTWATPPPGRVAVRMAFRPIPPPTGRARAAGAGTASGAPLAGSVPASVAMRPPWRLSRTRRVSRRWGGRCCCSACTTTASWPRWACTSGPWSR